MSQTQSQSRLDSNELFALSEAVMEKWEELFDEFGITYRVSKHMAYSACPIHGGDSNSAFNFYYEGDSSRGNWKCRTHGCEKYFVPSVLGLIRGVLSNQNGWSDGQRDRAKVVSFDRAIQFAKDFANVTDLSVDAAESERRRFNKQVKIFNGVKREGPLKITRDQIRKSLRIPSPYYVNRGYSKQVLDDYDIGECIAQDKEMSGRVVVPVYDNYHKFMAGCAGRSVFEECHKCELHHNPTLMCPTYNTWQYSKWRNSSGFHAENYLYNYWFAKEHIQESGVAVIVEGPGDVWRMVEAGIYNVVALFGTALTDGRKQLLDMSGAMSLIVLTDNDKAGLEAAENIRKICEREYRLFFPKLDTKDIGDMQKDLVTQDIGSLIDKVKAI